MKTSGVVFSGKRYFGSAAPPVGLPDVSRFKTDMVFRALGEPAWTRQPSGIWSMAFDQTDDYCRAATAPNLYFGLDSFSIAVWAKAAVKTTGAAWEQQTMVCLNPNNSVFYCIGRDMNQVRMYLRDSAANSDDWRSDFAISSGIFHHYVWTVDRVADVGRSYFDGVESAGSPRNIAAITANLGWTAGNNAHLGGAGDGAGGEIINGEIIPPLIVRYVLTPLQVARVFESERRWFGV